ncbi:MAG: DUF4886 domain-containing protein [Clostridia bacterium]|nr:DUF4886 domain-containing protein [Clostridia bacterium]
MKRIFCIILSLCLFVIVFSGCSSSGEEKISDEVIVEQVIIDQTSSVTSTVTSSEEQTTSSEPTTSEAPVSSNEQTSSQETPSTCVHQYKEEIKVEAKLYTMGQKQYTCANCGDSYMKDYAIEEIKILSISNSYGKNALWQLYDICKMEGIEKVDIAVMYIAGCSLDKHWENIQNNAAEYEVFRNNNGTWTSTKNCTIDSLLAEGDWDVITTQNSSGLSGKTDGYKNLNNVADYIKSKCPKSTLIWHLIWGYQSGSQWLTPNNYNGDEKFMFESIVNCTNDIVIPSKKFDSVAPVGTAIVNARSSSLKNIVHDSDGSHLGEELGYYVAAYTWFCHLTGASPYDTNFAASTRLSSDKMNVVLESVAHALENPYKVTQSYYTN